MIDPVPEEKNLAVDSVEYSEIDVVRERWGRPLLQVKDQKYGSIRLGKRKTAKATLDTHALSPPINEDVRAPSPSINDDVRAPSPSINDKVEELNNRQLIHYVSEPANDSRHGAESYQPAAAPVVKHAVPPGSSDGFVPGHGFASGHGFAPGLAPDQQVRFGLLPPAEISSIPAPWKAVTKEDRDERIQQIRWRLDQRHNDRQQQMEEDNNVWYECVDVAMDNYPGVREAGEEVMPEIVLRHSKKDDRLFQFEKKPVGVPRGELGRYHMGLGVPPREPPRNAPPQYAPPRGALPRDARDALPRDALPRDAPPRDALPRDALPRQAPLQKEKAGISPFRFYQGNAVPPSARASKGKQRAGPSHLGAHPPSSPLNYRYVNPYAPPQQQQQPQQRQQRPANVAGPSREAYM
jgi:hypothetical protein